MASLYRRKGTRFFWIEYIDSAGKLRQKSTKLRSDLTAEVRQARLLCSEMTAREKARKGTDLGELWDEWVPRFINQHYSGEGQELSLGRYLRAWHNIRAFLRVRQIAIPRQLTRQSVRDFIAWRKTAHREDGVYKGVKNTALLEIKFLSMVMDEAIESGFCTTNPCRKLGIGRDQAKRKPKITTNEHRLITRSLHGEDEWMRVSYRIAWEQGCRFSETHLRLKRDIDLAQNIIRLRTKGQKGTVAEVPLSPRLRPMFRRLLREGREYTFDMPKSAGKQWWNFFKRIGLPHLCFHCTRVTFITRCYEAGIPREDVMRLCLHASETVHQIYPRLPAASSHLQQRMRQVSSAA